MEYVAVLYSILIGNNRLQLYIVVLIGFTIYSIVFVHNWHIHLKKKAMHISVFIIRNTTHKEAFWQFHSNDQAFFQTCPRSELNTYDSWLNLWHILDPHAKSTWAPKQLSASTGMARTSSPGALKLVMIFNLKNGTEWHSASKWSDYILLICSNRWEWWQEKTQSQACEDRKNM